MECIIFVGGNSEPRLPDGIDTEGAYIIAADSGYINCLELGLKPDLAIGDFDSLGFEPHICETKVFPKEKDDTDLMLAVRYALEKGFKDITILGALGGRFDHTFANVQALAFILENGAIGKIVSCNERISLLKPGKYTFEKREGYSLSFFAYSEEVKDFSVCGTKYFVENKALRNSFPIGISNEILNEAKVSFKKGILLAMESKIN